MLSCHSQCRGTPLSGHNSCATYPYHRRNQDFKAEYTEEEASKKGFGGSCFTPLVSASPKCPTVYVRWSSTNVVHRRPAAAALNQYGTVPQREREIMWESASTSVQRVAAVLFRMLMLIQRIAGLTTPTEVLTPEPCVLPLNRVKSRRTWKAKGSMSKASVARGPWTKACAIICPVDPR